MADGGRFFAVRDEHEGGVRFVGQLAQQAKNVFAAGGIEIAGRFVGENERGPMDEGAGDRDALLLAAGELARQGGGAGSEADAFEQGGDTGFAFGGRDADELERQLDVFGGSESRQQVEELEDGSDLFAAKAGEGIAVELIDAVAVEGEATGVGPVDAAEAVEQGGLAAAGRAGEGDAFAGGDAEGDVIEHATRAVALGDGNHVENDLGGSGSHARGVNAVCGGRRTRGRYYFPLGARAPSSASIETADEGVRAPRGKYIRTVTVSRLRCGRDDASLAPPLKPHVQPQFALIMYSVLLRSRLLATAFLACVVAVTAVLLPSRVSAGDWTADGNVITFADQVGFSPDGTAFSGTVALRMEIVVASGQTKIRTSIISIIPEPGFTYVVKKSGGLNGSVEIAFASATHASKFSFLYKPGLTKIDYGVLRSR